MSFDLPEFGDQPATLRTRWIFPVWGPPLENGTIEITAGRITAVHDLPCKPDCDLGNYAMIPGLVNAHVHLELSDVQQQLTPPQPFTSWLKSVISHRRDRAALPNADALAVCGGLAESCRQGTTTLADIAGRPAGGASAGVASAPRTVSFLEILGLAPERHSVQMQRAVEHLAGKSTVLRGLSPHAPYSVHPDLLRSTIDLAVQHRVPVAMHLAETTPELELLATGSGEFVPFLKGLGVWRDDAIPHGSRPLDYLRVLARAPCALVVHGNYLDDEEIEFIADHPNLSVVYCPRTHAYFGHTPHPWRKLLARGVNVALGTDSRASNPDLSLFNELKFLRSLAPDFEAGELLKLGTFGGAFALGIEVETGNLALGKSADLAVVQLPASDSGDPYSLLFDPCSRIAATICAGVRV